MSLSSVLGISNLSEAIKTANTDSAATALQQNGLGNRASFETFLKSAEDMIKETEALTNAAEEAELNYAMGKLTSVHELQVAQQKANISLQYTVAVRNAALEAYREIMQMQF